MRYILELCLLGGFALAVGSLLRPQDKVRQDEAAKAPPKKPAAVARFFSGLRHWWTNLRADPKACGLLLLLLWQIVPGTGAHTSCAAHSAALPFHDCSRTIYFHRHIPHPPDFLVPLARTRKTMEQRSYATYVLVAFILVIQLLGSSASLVDTTNGINNHIFGYNGIGSLASMHFKRLTASRRNTISAGYTSRFPPRMIMIFALRIPVSRQSNAYTCNPFRIEKLPGASFTRRRFRRHANEID